MPYANNKGTDQPAHPRSLISTFVVLCLNSMIRILAISKVSRHKLVSIYAGWFESLLVAKPEDRFSRDIAQIIAILFESITYIVIKKSILP